MKINTFIPLALALVACDPASDQDVSATAGPSAPSTTASSSASTAAASNAAAPSADAAIPSASAPTPDPKSLCTKKDEKVWTRGVNQLTGLTTKRMPDGRLAIGLAKGTIPHVLVVDAKGEGQLIKVPPRAGTKLAESLSSKEGNRVLLRVTPYEVTGDQAKAYVDFRDTYEDKRRFIACGPADGDAWLSFEGVPLLDRDPAPSDEERAALFAKGTEPGSDPGYHELRECRTFIDIKKGETYIIGSELRAFDGGEGKTKYAASLVVDKGPDRHEIHLYDIPLPGDPPKQIGEFETPVTHGVKDGSYLLMTRFGGTLKVAFLNENKTLQGQWKSYPGYSNRTEADRDDEGFTMLVTAMSMGKGKGFELQGARIGPANELPAKLVHIEPGESEPGKSTEPMFLRDQKGQRWLSYTQGERGQGKSMLKLVPVDETFKPLAPPFVVQEDVSASEPRLVGLDDGGILVVYLRNVKGKGTELVGTTLSCDQAG